MAGYPTNASMADVLRAMKEKILQDNTQLKYLRDVRITSNVYWPPYDSPMLYLRPQGTIEDVEGEYNSTDSIRPRHIVRVDCIIHTGARADSEEALMGSSKEPGLINFAGDVLSFYENNWLGLSGQTGLQQGVGPICRAEEDTYIQTSDTEESIFFNIARLRYEAQTRALIRPTDT